MRLGIGRWPAWLLTYLPVRFARKRATNHTATPVLTDGNQRQLLIDVSVIHQRDARTGIQRVVRSLLLQLRNEPPVSYLICPVYATRWHGYCHAEADFLERSAPQAPLTKNRIPVVTQDGDIFLGLDLAAHLVPRHQAQILQWKNVGVKVHMVVYDLLPLQRPEWFNAKTTRNFKRWIRWIAIYADSAICISETVKLGLQTWLAVKFDLPHSSLITNTIILGADIAASAPSQGLPPGAELLLAKMRSTRNVLMVGTIEPRKGYTQVIAAFEQMWIKTDSTTLLVIVGRPGWKSKDLQERLRRHPQAGKRLFWLEDASDEYLSRLYAVCSGVLVASYGEGFGLPLIEAALQKKPILARNLAVFRELNTINTTYFDDEIDNDLSSIITHWLENNIFPAITNANYCEPTWQRSAYQLVQLLKLKK